MYVYCTLSKHTHESWAEEWISIVDRVREELEKW